jgi:hypothetical protein
VRSAARRRSSPGINIVKTPNPGPSSRPRLRDIARAERRTVFEITVVLFNLSETFHFVTYFFFLDFEAVHRQSRKKGQVCPNEWTWRRRRLTSCASNETFHRLRNGESMPVRKPLEGLANSHGEKTR